MPNHPGFHRRKKQLPVTHFSSQFLNACQDQLLAEL